MGKKKRLENRKAYPSLMGGECGSGGGTNGTGRGNMEERWEAVAAQIERRSDREEEWCATQEGVGLEGGQECDIRLREEVKKNVGRKRKLDGMT